jgi:hypothetical protein
MADVRLLVVFCAQVLSAAFRQAIRNGSYRHSTTTSGTADRCRNSATTAVRVSFQPTHASCVDVRRTIDVKNVQLKIKT